MFIGFYRDFFFFRKFLCILGMKPVVFHGFLVQKRNRAEPEKPWGC